MCVQVNLELTCNHKRQTSLCLTLTHNSKSIGKHGFALLAPAWPLERRIDALCLVARDEEHAAAREALHCVACLQLRFGDQVPDGRVCR